MGGWGAWGDKAGAQALPPPCLPHPRVPHPVTKPVALPLPSWQAAWPGPFSKEAHFLPPWAGLDELSSCCARSVLGHTPTSICALSPGQDCHSAAIPRSPAHPLRHLSASDPGPSESSCPLLLTPQPPPQKAGAGTPSLRPPAPFGSPCEPTSAQAPTRSPASGHRIRPSAQSPRWTAWIAACSPWSLSCCWPSAALAPQVGVEGPGWGNSVLSAHTEVPGILGLLLVS
jgi:hypothetical protein